MLRPGVPDDAAELAALLVATRRAAEPAMPPMVSSQEQAVVFLGRRGIAGVDVGSTVVVEGTVGVQRGRLAILTPTYTLVH